MLRIERLRGREIGMNYTKIGSNGCNRNVLSGIRTLEEWKGKNRKKIRENTIIFQKQCNLGYLGGQNPILGPCVMGGPRLGV